MEIENIKFKAKRLDNGEWVEGDLLHFYENGVIIAPVEESGAYSVDPSTVCQFTGVKAERGKEVWEHDILDSPGIKGEVVFSNGSFRIKKDDSISYPFSQIFMIDGKIDYCRIVGNKFDRKEGDK